MKWSTCVCTRSEHGASTRRVRAAASVFVVGAIQIIGLMGDNAAEYQEEAGVRRRA
ncbi:MAG: hypothetical protein R2710_01840 [Acidimicrobiales bacterium]